MYFFNKKLSNFGRNVKSKSSRVREEIVQGSNNFVRPTKIFEILRFEILGVFLPKEVRNVQGTEEFVRGIKKFEKLSIHRLSVNYVLKNVKCRVMFTEAYLEPSRTSVMELFYENS